MKKLFFWKYLLIIFLLGRISQAQPKLNYLPEDLRADVEKILKEKHKATGAVVAVLNKGNVSFGAYGTKKYDSSEKIGLDTFFRIGSLSKVLTTLGILTLEKEGQLNLQDPLKKHIPWFQLDGFPQWDKKITLQQLLGHRSGISREYGCIFSVANGDWVSMPYLKNCVKNRTVFFEPGSEVKYSNLGFNLLGLVISRKMTKNTGDDTEALPGFNDFMVNKVLRPLNMPLAKFEFQESDAGKFAQGYGVVDPKTDRRKPVKFATTAHANMPSYYLGMTALDLPPLLNVLRSIWNKRDIPILSGKSIHRMFEDRMKDKYSNYEYGLGLTVIPGTNGRYLIGHSGGAPGFRVYAIYDTSADIAIGVFANTHDNASRDIADLLMKKLVPGSEGVVPLQDQTTAVAETPEQKSIFSGSYQLWSQQKLDIYTVGVDPATRRPVLDILYDGKRRRMIPVPQSPMKYQVPLEGPYSGSRGETFTFIKEPNNSIQHFIFADGYVFDRQ